MNLGGKSLAMAMAMANPSLCNLANSASPMAAPPKSSLFFDNLLKPPLSLSFTPHTHLFRLPIISFSHRLPSFSNRRLPVFSFAASHEQDSSKLSDIEVDENKNSTLVKEGTEELQQEAAWKETLASFKEQALKMQSVSQEAYELYSKKAIVILKETSEKLKIQADKASQDLSVVANEIALESKEYLSNVAENYPEPVKDIVETFASSADDLNQASKVRDFYLGIPYGALLSAGGFLSFMISGNLSAIRFGVILGGTLLVLSISSLRSWKKGESSSLALKGQGAISTILFLREVRLLFSRPFITNFITAFISGAVVAFYAYRIVVDREQAKGSNLEREADG